MLKSRYVEYLKRRISENLIGRKVAPLSWCIVTPTGKRKNIKGRDTSQVIAVIIRSVVLDPY